MTLPTITVAIGLHVDDTPLPEKIVAEVPRVLRDVVRECAYGYVVQVAEERQLDWQGEPTVLAYAYPGLADAHLDRDRLALWVDILARAYGQDCIAVTYGDTAFIGPRPWA